MEEDEMGGRCRTHWEDEKCIQNFSREIQREESTLVAVGVR
jgi:hypothetical protein